MKAPPNYFNIKDGDEEVIINWKTSTVKFVCWVKLQSWQNGL